jgi:predicted oxidoreductase
MSIFILAMLTTFVNSAIFFDQGKSVSSVFIRGEVFNFGGLGIAGNCFLTGRFCYLEVPE